MHLPFIELMVALRGGWGGWRNDYKIGRMRVVLAFSPADVSFCWSVML